MSDLLPEIDPARAGLATGLSDVRIAIIGTPDRLPSNLYDDLGGTRGGDRIAQLTRVRTSAGSAATIERRITSHNGMTFEASISGASDIIKTVPGETTKSRLPAGVSLVDDDKIHADVDNTFRWASANVHGAIVIISKSAIISRTELRLFRAAEEAFDGRVVGVIRDSTNRTGDTAGIIAELTAKLGHPVVFAPTSPPGGPWGADALWSALEQQVERLAGFVDQAAEENNPSGEPQARRMNDLDVGGLILRARDDLANLQSIAPANVDEYAKALATAQSSWRRVMEASLEGHNNAEKALVEVLENRRGFRLLEFEPVDVLSAMQDGVNRLSGVAALGLTRPALVLLRGQALGKAALNEVEIFLLEQAERSHDVDIAQELIDSNQPDVATRAALVVGDSQITDFEDIAAQPHLEPIEMLRRLVDATTQFEDWATRSQKSGSKQVAYAVVQTRNRADAARRMILANASSAILVSISAMYEGAVLDLPRWERDRLATLSAANLWLSLAPKSEDWAKEIRQMMMLSIEYSKGPGDRWARKSASNVNFARRKAERVLEAWYALALLGGVLTGISLLMIIKTPAIAAVLGPCGVALIVVAMSKHRSNRSGLSWANYYVHPALPPANGSPS